eukprot:Rhum_TRINITY_DN7823_c0_g2::Rhum_TRINITY_DN7823_c0_g2_i1::g.24816::m.24816/K02975/RP-S25e, RPS25; small subunit ribosomal protein S25e
MPPKKADAKSSKKAAPKKGGSKGGKQAKKKKWSKGKTRDKLDNAVMWTKNTLDKLEKEVPNYKVITINAISERLKVNGSLARQALNHLEGKGAIRRVSFSSGIRVYTKAKEA